MSGPESRSRVAILTALEDGSELTRNELINISGFGVDMIKRSTLRLVRDGKVEYVRTGHVWRYRMTKRFLGDKCLLASCWTRAGEAAEVRDGA